MSLLREEETEKEQPGLQEFTLRIVLFQKSFPNQPKANMGLIAHEVARAFASDDVGIKQMIQPLSDSEKDSFKKMNIETRMKWLIEKWGFREEFEALKKEMAAAKPKDELETSLKG